MADAKQDFTVLAYPVLRLEDSKRLSTRLLPYDDILKADAVRCGFEDSLLCGKSEPRVSWFGAAVDTTVEIGTYRDAMNRAAVPTRLLGASRLLFSLMASTEVSVCFPVIGSRILLAAVRSSSVRIRLMNFAAARLWSICFTLGIRQISVPILNGRGKGANLDVII